MRGDRPDFTIEEVDPAEFTPHARGSTRELRDLIGSFVVYPACAGIDPEAVYPPRVNLCLPRMRGDRPIETPAE